MVPRSHAYFGSAPLVGFRGAAAVGRSGDGGNVPILFSIQKPEGRRVVSCGWPDLDLESEITDAIGELGYGAEWVTAGEMIGAKVLVASAVSQHMVGSGQDRGRDGESSFLRAAACL